MPAPPAIIARLKALFPPSSHGRIFLVGGMVRDLLLHQPHLDIDLAAALTADEFSRLGFSLIQGKSTAPLWFRHDPELGTIEITPLDNCAQLTADLTRRDFTVNAMAMALDGMVIDPIAGKRDLDARQLSPCSATVFHDDPLRILRAFRFESSGWRLSPETLALLHSKPWEPELRRVPVERCTREMLKALAAPAPHVFFQRMLELQIGSTYLPELHRMPAIPAGPPQHHPEGDLASHSLQVLERTSMLSPYPLARFCALFHDLGKLATDPALLPRHHGHDRTGSRMAAPFCARLRLPAVYGRALAWVCRYHGMFNQWEELRDSTRIRMAQQAIRSGIERILPQVSAADKPGPALATIEREWTTVLRIAAMTATELGLNPPALEGVPPAKRAEVLLQHRIATLRTTK